jgi:ubiquinone/menaquinone biosynthesis C-methylase UbiE
MSHFENYTSKQFQILPKETSQNYDATRIPVGIDKILEFSKSLKKPLSELSLLDCGCGSGNYLVELQNILELSLELVCRKNLF